MAQYPAKGCGSKIKHGQHIWVGEGTGYACFGHTPQARTVTMTIPANRIKPRDYLVAMDVTVVSVSHLPEFHVVLRYLGGKGCIYLPKVTDVTVHREVQV